MTIKFTPENLAKIPAIPAEVDLGKSRRITFGLVVPTTASVEHRPEGYVLLVEGVPHGMPVDNIFAISTQLSTATINILH